MRNFLKQIITLFLTLTLATGCVTTFRNCINNDFKHAPRESFVKILALTPEFMSSGSGVIINHIGKSSIVLTAGHVCNHTTISMKILDLQENEYEFLGMIRSKEDDLCAIIVSGIIPGKAIRAADKSPSIADHVYNISAPIGIHAPNMSLMLEGYYQGDVTLPSEKYIMSIHSIPGTGGSSGSPIFNEDWEIIGIVSRGMSDFDEILITVNQQRTKNFIDYVNSSQFIIDMTEAKNQTSKNIVEFLKTLQKK